MKGGIAGILDAVSQIDFAKLKRGVKLYFTFDEEIGFGGTCELIKNNEKFTEIMVFGEPTNNELLVGRKGLMEYEIYFKGIKAHSSDPEKGVSANLNAVSFLYELNSFYKSEIKPYEEKIYEIPYTTMNVGIINGGSAKNSIPASCLVCIDFRIANKKHSKIIENKIESLAKTYDAEVKIIESIEPFFNDLEFVEKTKTANFMTEASFIKNSKRIILGTGPVTAHEVNEHISKSSYRKLVEQYKGLIYKICK